MESSDSKSRHRHRRVPSLSSSPSSPSPVSSFSVSPSLLSTRSPPSSSSTSLSSLSSSTSSSSSLSSSSSAKILPQASGSKTPNKMRSDQNHDSNENGALSCHSAAPTSRSHTTLAKHKKKSSNRRRTSSSSSPRSSSFPEPSASIKTSSSLKRIKWSPFSFCWSIPGRLANLCIIVTKFVMKTLHFTFTVLSSRLFCIALLFFYISIEIQMQGIRKMGLCNYYDASNQLTNLPNYFDDNRMAIEEYVNTYIYDNDYRFENEDDSENKNRRIQKKLYVVPLSDGERAYLGVSTAFMGFSCIMGFFFSILSVICHSYSMLKGDCGNCKGPGARENGEKKHLCEMRSDGAHEELSGTSGDEECKINGSVDICDEMNGKVREEFSTPTMIATAACDNDVISDNLELYNCKNVPLNNSLCSSFPASTPTSLLQAVDSTTEPQSFYIGDADDFDGYDVVFINHDDNSSFINATHRHTDDVDSDDINDFVAVEKCRKSISLDYVGGGESSQVNQADDHDDDQLITYPFHESKPTKKPDDDEEKHHHGNSHYGPFCDNGHRIGENDSCDHPASDM